MTLIDPNLRAVPGGLLNYPTGSVVLTTSIPFDQPSDENGEILIGSFPSFAIRVSCIIRGGDASEGNPVDPAGTSRAINWTQIKFNDGAIYPIVVYGLPASSTNNYKGHVILEYLTATGVDPDDQ